MFEMFKSTKVWIALTGVVVVGVLYFFKADPSTIITVGSLFGLTLTGNVIMDAISILKGLQGKK